MGEIIYQLKDYKHFLKSDLEDEFFQDPLRGTNRHKTAFRVQNRLYKWKKILMRFKNYVKGFQHLMNLVLKEEEKVLGYVEDILVFT